jgi:hypothetical protein
LLAGASPFADFGVEDEQLCGYVGVGVDAADEAAYGAARGLLDGVDELCGARVLEERAGIPQQLVLIHRLKVPLGRRERVLE